MVGRKEAHQKHGSKGQGALQQGFAHVRKLLDWVLGTSLQ